MLEYPWPGNVRELRNVIERACLLRQGDELKPADILVGGPSYMDSHPEAPSADSEPSILPLEEVTSRHIQSALKACGGNKSRAARVLGISLSTLKRKLKQLEPSRTGAK